MAMRYSTWFAPAEIPLDLIYPRDEEPDQPQALRDEEPEHPQPSRYNIFQSKVRTLSMSLYLWIFTAIFVILYSIYVYRALLSPSPHLGNLLLSASNTNVLLSVLSQFFAALVHLLFTSALDSFRWQLAYGGSGVSMATFFELSTATDWFPLLLLAVGGLMYAFWGIVRLAIPLAGLFFGSVLKFQATFEYYFHRVNAEVGVFAGLMPLDKRVLNFIHQSRICLYFLTFTPTLLGISKYAISMPAPDCNGNCTSVFLPGGLETARMLRPVLNSTLLEGGLLENAEAIRIHNAPGFLLKFGRLHGDFDFDRERECTAYGQEPSDGIQICISSINNSLAVGWAACPSSQIDPETCVTNTSWTRAPINKKLIMTVFKQYATTTYKREDLSILDVHNTSKPQIQPLDLSDFTEIWSKIFIPRNKSDSTDITMINALTFSLTWLLRLYDDVFPDDANTPLTHLQNFLAIPLQFMVTCAQFANSSAPTGITGIFVLPEDMQTTAASGDSTQRLLGQTWVVWTFIVAAGLVMITVGGVFLWILLQPEPLPNLYGIPEMDIIAGVGQMGGDPGLVRLRELATHETLADGSVWSLVKSLRQYTAKLHEGGPPAGRWLLRADERGFQELPGEPERAEESLVHRE